MGENLAIEGRQAVRTPMHWTSSPAAGFTTAPPDAACRPFPEGDYAPAEVNVASQRTEPESLLNWFERLIRLRRDTPEVGWGSYEVLDTGDDAVLGLRFDWDGRTTITLHNLAKSARKVKIDLGRGALRLHDRIGSADPIEVDDTTAALKLDAHGYRWFGLDVDV
jgi:maltose alpha-D-glucosyltransferase/alpha-amylase